TALPNPWMAHYAFAWEANNLPKEVTLPNGSKIKYTYDGYRTLYKIEASDATTVLELGRNYYDNDLVPSKSRRVLPGSINADTTVYRNHSGKGYPFKIQDPTDVVTTVTYNVHGAITAVERRPNDTSPVGMRTTFEPDEMGAVRKSWRHEVDASGTTVATHEYRTFYDVRRSVERMEGPLGRAAHYTYDAIGRLKTARDNLSTQAADCNEVEYVWESGRDLVQRVIAKVFEEADDATPPTGTRKDYWTEFSYDLLGRLTERKNKGHNGTQPVLQQKLFYDSLGNVAKSEDALGRNSFGTFDATGRWIEAWRDNTVQGASPNRVRLSAEYVDAQTDN